LSPPPAAPLPRRAHHHTATLFAEEPGAIPQAAKGKEATLPTALHDAGLHAEIIGTATAPDDGEAPTFRIEIDGERIFDDNVLRLTQVWSETSFQMAQRRDNPETARQEYEQLANVENTGLFARVRSEE